MVILIVIVILLLFGATKIPELAKAIGRGMGEFRRGKMEVEREIQKEFKTSDSSDETRRKKVVAVAKAFKIETSGKSEDDLRLEVARIAEKAEQGQLIDAAKAGGVEHEGVGLDDIRRRVISAVH